MIIFYKKKNIYIENMSWQQKVKKDKRLFVISEKNQLTKVPGKLPDYIPQSVRTLLPKIKSILKDGDEESIGKIINVEDIEFLPIELEKYRRCNVIMCVQKSNRGVRYLVFLMNTLNHSAESFGSSVYDVNIKETRERFIDKLNEKQRWIEKNLNFKFKNEPFDDKFGISFKK
jgi:hypothetical protein